MHSVSLCGRDCHSTIEKLNNYLELSQSTIKGRDSAKLSSVLNAGIKSTKYRARQTVKIKAFIFIKTSFSRKNLMYVNNW